MIIVLSDEHADCQDNGFGFVGWGGGERKRIALPLEFGVEVMLLARIGTVLKSELKRFSSGLGSAERLERGERLEVVGLRQAIRAERKV